MSDLMIRVEGLAKKYKLGSADAYQSSLRELATKAITAPGSLWRANPEEEKGDFWALRDVSFELRRGEVAGIIGRNGAGKSTLLKVLSRITAPTKGRAEIYGRLGSLLEVGTGFHPELSGRDNIFLNGAILGMRRHEIERKFDDIVAFAEIDQFVDTPVKRYSSGMYVRLAFSVAAHLDTEILLVDEVLAVGDTNFQKKCLAKMDSIAQDGRTIIFISHSMPLMQTLCTKGLMLSNGVIEYQGEIGGAIARYLRQLEDNTSYSLLERVDRRGAGAIKLASFAAHGITPDTPLITGQPASFCFQLAGSTPAPQLYFKIFDHLGAPVTHLTSARPSPDDRTEKANGHAFRCDIPELPLIGGRYRIEATLWNDGELQDHMTAVAFIDVESGVWRGRAPLDDQGSGAILMPHSWVIERPA